MPLDFRSVPTSFLMVLLMSSFIFGNNYYIATRAENASDTNSGAVDTPWKTIAKANKTLKAGDTVFIKGGTYSDYISPSNSGSASHPVVYSNTGSESVIVRNAAYAINFSGKSHVIVKGITFRNLDRFVYLRDRSNYNTITQCTFDSARLVDGQVATWAGSVISGNSQYNHIDRCRFSVYGCFDEDDNGCILNIGTESSRTDSTRYNLIENSLFFHAGHHVMGIYGKFNVIRKNYFHNEPWSKGTEASDRGAVLYGDRNLSFSGYKENGGDNLIENNRIGYSADPSDNNGASGMSLGSSRNIVRFNAFFNNISAGLSMSVTSSYLQDIIGNKVYCNTFFNNGHNPYNPNDHMSSGFGFGIYSGSLVIKDNVFKNNLLFRHRIPFGEYNINTSDRKGILTEQVFENNWDGDKRGDPLFVHADTGAGNPMDSTMPDLRLKPGSPCIDSGAALTGITSNDGSGKTFNVDDASYFFDGWGIQSLNGDEIQLFDTPQRARIVSIDYEENRITVDRPVSWKKGQGVCLAYEGSAPDIGSFETIPAVSVTSCGKSHDTRRGALKRSLSGQDAAGSPFTGAIFSIQGRFIGNSPRKLTPNRVFVVRRRDKRVCSKIVSLE